MRCRILLFWALFFLPVILKAQKLQFNPDPLMFGKEFAAELQNRGMPQLGSDFETSWNSKISVEQKKKLAEIFPVIQDKGLKLDPHLQRLAGLIVAAADHSDISSQAFDNFVSTLHSAARFQSNKDILAFLETTVLLLDKRAFFSSNYNSLIIDGGTIDFEYSELSSNDPLEGEVIEEEETAGLEEPAEQEDDWFG
jgi:hypothetical protein